MFLLVNKPTGITSHDVVNVLRRITGIKKIGHAGTLDPLATGLLIVAINRESTKEIDRFVKLDKEYVATIKLGATSDTYDAEGKIIPASKSLAPSLDEIKKTINVFIGRQQQIPPMFSAKKIGGKKLYDLARAGKEIERAPSEIEIFSIKILEYSYPILKINVHCSSGTYIRSLANDIGASLGVGGYLAALERTKIGKYELKNSVALAELDKNNWKNYAS
ncbi:MAG: tRNA pseudouridine(55) synthase TruB [Patescibacteria group bacterium]|jgi:tRNA pseudouridine55 synthase